MAYDSTIDIFQDLRHSMTPLNSRGLDLLGELNERCMSTTDPGQRQQSRILTQMVLSPIGSGVSPITSPAEIKHLLKTTLSALLAHKELYLSRGILHRDISINNILHNSRKGMDGEPEGLLIDLDYASFVGILGTNNRTTNPRPTGAPHRTGTLPFMALPVLQYPHTCQVPIRASKLLLCKYLVLRGSRLY